MASKTGDSDSGRIMKISELPIYEKPEVKVKLIPEPPCAYREGISQVRSSIWSYLDSIQDTTDKVKEKYDTGKAHTMATLDYLQEGDVRPKVVFIGASGLAGLALGYRGGVFRRTFLSLFGITAATAIVYPHEAVDLTKKQYQKIKDKFN
ncbi:hypothetical protein ACF0H5_023077 [Mactra antiquata]